MSHQQPGVDEAFLSQMPLFTSLSPAEVHFLASSLPRLDLAPQTIFVHEGDFGDRFYIVLSGEVEVIKALGTEDQRFIWAAGPGEFVGEMSLLNRDARRTASLRTRTPVQLLEMHRTELDALLQRQPTVAYDLARELSLHLKQTDNATIADLHEKNRQLAAAYEELKAAQAQIIEQQALQRELEVARRIQESMLPHTLPDLGGFDFGARMVAARSVGGDFFDFMALDGDRVGIAIGDVSGKGVPGALLMALTRSLLRAEVSRSSTPREMLQCVNRHLLEMNNARMFVTLLYGVLDRTTGAFTYARAGHELPLVVDADGAVSLPPLGAGQPLGLLPDPDLDEQTVSVPADGLLLLYTDGVTEAMNPQGTLFGMERLQEAVRAHRHAAAQTVCNQLLQMVLGYHDGMPQADDVTLVVVRSR